MAGGDLDDGALQFFGEGGALLGRGKAKPGVDRKSGEPLPCCGGQFHGTCKLGLQLGCEPEQVLGRKRVRDLARIGGKLAEQFGRQNIAARRGYIALFKKMTATTAACAGQEASASELADMVIHRLSGELHTPCDARGGVGLEEGGENS